MAFLQEYWPPLGGKLNEPITQESKPMTQKECELLTEFPPYMDRCVKGIQKRFEQIETELTFNDDPDKIVMAELLSSIKTDAMELYNNCCLAEAVIGSRSIPTYRTEWKDEF